MSTGFELNMNLIDPQTKSQFQLASEYFSYYVNEIETILGLQWRVINTGVMWSFFQSNEDDPSFNGRFPKLS